MREALPSLARIAGVFVGIAVLTSAVLLAFDVYVSPGLAISAAFPRLCGL